MLTDVIKRKDWETKVSYKRKSPNQFCQSCENFRGPPLYSFKCYCEEMQKNQVNNALVMNESSCNLYQPQK